MRHRRLRVALAALAVVGGLLPIASPGPVKAVEPVIVLPQIELPARHKITGFITTSDGAPVDAITVKACDADGRCRADLTSGDAGGYLIRGLRDGVYRVHASPTVPSDMVAGWYTPAGPVFDQAQATDVVVAGADVDGIDLELQVGHRVEGTVTGSGIGPLAGVTVRADGPAGSASTTTDAVGAYTIRGLRDGTYGLWLEVPNALNHRSGPVVSGSIGSPSATPTPLAVAGADIGDRNILTATGRRLSGRLEGGAGAVVVAVGSGGERRVAADGYGDWILRGLHPGSYTLRFELPGLEPVEQVPSLGVWSGEGLLALDPEDAIAVDVTGADALHLDARAASVPRVTGSFLGPSGQYVRLCSQEPPCIVRRVDSSSFSIRRLPVGTYTYEVLNPAYRSGFVGVGGYVTDEAHALPIHVGPSTTPLPQAQLFRGAEIRGTVSGSCQCLGASVRVAVEPIPEDGMPWAAGADARLEGGAYQLMGLSPGSYKVRVEASDGSWLFGYYAADAPGRLTDDPALATPVIIPKPTGSTFVPIAPMRVLDSRVKIGVLAPFVRNTWQSFPVAGVGSIPANAIAVTGNLTVTGQTTAGYAVLGPTGTSTLNFPLGDNRANNFTVPLDDGKLRARVWAESAHLIADITGYFVPGTDAATYTPLDPVRVMDSRPASRVGVSGGFRSGVPRTITVAGANGIPADAIAVTANLTAVGQSAAGYLAVTRTATADPSTSTLNFPKGDVRANGLTAALDETGRLAIVYRGPAEASTHAILDITGYYRTGADGLRFHLFRPSRVLDTRTDRYTSLLTGRFAHAKPRTMAIAGQFLVPTDAAAITGNLTVTGPTGGGYVSATTTPTATPSTSTLNVPAGDTRANGLTVGLDGAGELSLVYRSTSGALTHVILDVTGYFAAP